ncbi:circularly permutated Ras protein 1 [Aplysia californica]|uniref:Circularly permutated Ras protein 1 n=1 Tax=Aplysia californica TaxID=6500 RepID=A0ABM0JAT6_APLCA|nr:circularly permutated Ras protein 1 [Aplysia californica]
MEFASDYILAVPDVEYECVSDDEFDRGMSVSDSDSSDEEADCAPNQAEGRERALRSPKKKPKMKTKSSHHWKSGSKAVSSESAEKRQRTASDQAPAGAAARAAAEARGKRWFRRADTNVVSVNFNTLLSPGNMHAGDPVVCQKCGAILSHVSKTTVEGEEQKTWVCEFCDEANVVDVEEEEVPKVEDVTYLLRPAMTTSHSSMSGLDQSLVIFCVDTSGSMCVTTEINGKVKLRGTAQLKRLQSFNETREAQWLPSQRMRDVTYVSRLQAMQAAVDHQLGEMWQTFPHRRVALITFSNEVSVVGDGSQAEVTIAGDKLNSEEQLRKEGTELSLPHSVRNSRKLLGDKVYKLEEGGATALGPALVVAVSMASHHPGSKVIVCTDGKANIGLGKMEQEEDEEAANDFYTSVGDRAVDSGVTISVVTIQGTDCKLVHLGKLADKTGGQVNIVDPMKLREEFSNVLADPIIATKVKATFILYKDLYVYNEDEPDSQPCRVEQQVGNVNRESAVTFQFARRLKPKADKATEKQTEGATASEATGPAEATTSEATGPAEDVPSASGSAEMPQSDLPSASGSAEMLPRTDLPFQLQIEYTDTEGNQALRVITRSMPVTSERTQAERHMNMEVLGVHAAKTAADMALKGKYSRSRGISLMNQRLAWRHSNEQEGVQDRKESKGMYKNIFGKLRRMENMVQRQQQSEVFSHGRTHSDDEDFDYGIKPAEGVPDTKKEHSHRKPRSKGSMARKNKRMHSERSKEMEDDMAHMVYQFRSVGKDELSSRVPQAYYDQFSIASIQCRSSAQSFPSGKGNSAAPSSPSGKGNSSAPAASAASSSGKDNPAEAPMASDSD